MQAASVNADDVLAGLTDRALTDAAPELAQAVHAASLHVTPDETGHAASRVRVAPLGGCAASNRRGSADPRDRAPGRRRADRRSRARDAVALVGAAVERIGRAANLGVLANATASTVRDLIGYDRVMVYKFDADGHGEIIAEASDPRLESLLGHHYPATDIPQRARELYLRNRVRCSSTCALRSVAAASRRRPAGRRRARHVDVLPAQHVAAAPAYLKNMGVTATLVVSLVHEGRLWGLIAAHHYAPRNVRHALRAACDLLGEVVSTRIAAIENYAHAQVAVLVRQLEQRLVEATSNEGDWRLALFRNPGTLLQPMDASGAALFAEARSSRQARFRRRRVARAAAVAAQHGELLFSCSSVAKVSPALGRSRRRPPGCWRCAVAVAPDFLMWFRKEQLRTVTWAGDPTKPMVGNDPLTLSPPLIRRVVGLVRGTAVPWTGADLALARAFGLALVDYRGAGARGAPAGCRAPARRDPQRGRPRRRGGADHRRAGPAPFLQCRLPALTGREGSAATACRTSPRCLPRRRPCATACSPSAAARASGARTDLAAAVGRGTAGRRARRGRAGARWPAAGHRRDACSTCAATAAPRSPGATWRPRCSARCRSRRATVRWGHTTTQTPGRGSTPLGAILTNASLAAMDIDEGLAAAPVAPILEELESSTRRATLLYERIRGLSVPPPAPA